jgi:hypothetical protein
LINLLPLPNEAGRAEETFASSCVNPVIRENGSCEFPPLQVPLRDVGDFEFASRGRPESSDDVEAASVVQVTTGLYEIALRLRGFFFDRCHPVSLQFHNAEALRVRNFFHEDVATLPERVDHGTEIIEENIVSEDHTDGILPDEFSCHPESLCDAFRSFLDAVREFCVPSFAGSEELHELPGLLRARDDDDLFGPCFEKNLERVKDERLVVDG